MSYALGKLFNKPLLPKFGTVLLRHFAYSIRTQLKHLLKCRQYSDN